MQLTINNICSVEKMSVEFNGITILAGKNGTGKSTLSKSLWTIYSALFKTKEYIEWMFKKNALEYLKMININNANFDYGKINDLCTELFAFRRDNKLLNSNNLYDAIKKVIIDFINLYQNGQLKYNENIFNDVVSNIEMFINKKDDEIVVDRVLNYLNYEFCKSPYDVRKDNNSCMIELLFSNGNKNSIIINNKEAEVNIDEDIQFPIFYFDGLNVDYNLDLNSYDERIENYRHKDAFDGSLIFEDTSMTINRNDEYFEKIDHIFSKFGYFGKVYRENDKLNYKEMNYLYPINPHLIAQGLKNVIVLYQFFKTKKRDKRTLLILDEPEMNLHPEWQVILAEVICDLEEYLDLTILLCSHSPWFISALKTHISSEKYNMNEIVKYYLTDKDTSGNSIVNDVTASPDKIFENLYTPIIELKDENGLL